MKKISIITIIFLGCLLGLNMPLSAQSTGTENGHEWVDLGLPSGLKWATCNVGASKPELYGSYFAWGGIKPQENFTYEFNGMCLDDMIGNVQYDAARANWGGNWRMATSIEIDELINSCIWEWTKQNGVEGYKVVGINGNSIFLPATGYKYEWDFYSGSCGTSNYMGFYFFDRNVGLSVYYNSYGQTVRPVLHNNRVVAFVESCTDVIGIIKTYVTSDVGTITERGFYYGINSEPSEADNKVVLENEAGYKMNVLLDLTPNTTYYVKAYAANSEGTSYSEVVSFTTLETPVEYEYVDLGLPSGLKWAIHNIGATTPEECGNYYAWGEVVPKGRYSLDNSLMYEQTIADISGNAQYDAATANWGGEWRMPTYNEIEELLSNCTWLPLSQNGVSGFKVVGTNGNSIFLPYTGYKTESGHGKKENGFYWSSYRYNGNSNWSTYIHIEYSLQTTNSIEFYYGLPIRPVRE